MGMSVHCSRQLIVDWALSNWKSDGELTCRGFNLGTQKASSIVRAQGETVASSIMIRRVKFAHKMIGPLEKQFRERFISVAD